MPKMLTTQDVFQILQREKPYIEQQFHVKELGVFGSFVRDEQRLRSDVDILVDFDRVVSVFVFIRLKSYLSDRLGRRVDLVSKPALKPRIGKRILAEVKLI